MLHIHPSVAGCIFFSSRRRHTRCLSDWSSDVCSSDLMLWKRASPAGGFCGLASGTAASIGMWAWVKLDPTALRYVALSPHAKDMAENMFRALWSWILCLI